jgi:anthranilate phosphoribosyltransferase
MFDDALRRLAGREALTAPETKAIFDRIFEGDVPDDVLANLLVALADKGETADEILGAAQSMRANMIPLPGRPDAIDIVGTGGDKLGTLNISTAAAIVVAAAGVPVAKHGNRAASSLSGSSDVLAALGVNLEPSDRGLERCLNELGLVFLFAPRHHPAMRHVAPVRRALGRRTIFNFLGPLTNPANVRRSLIGVAAASFLPLLGETAQKLGLDEAWLANGGDGMDEITTTGITHLLKVTPAVREAFDLDPVSYGLPHVTLAALRGGDALKNAEALRALLEGTRGAYRDIVVLNSAAALTLAGATPDLAAGLTRAGATIDSGAARQKLADLVALTNEP